MPDTCNNPYPGKSVQWLLGKILCYLRQVFGADPSGTVPVSGSVSVTGPLPAGTNTIGATMDAGPAWATVRGIAGVPFASADQSAAPASVTDIPTIGQSLVVDDILVSVDTDMAVTLKEETSGTVIHGPFYMAANSTLQVTLRGKTKLPVANKRLQVITSAAGNIMVEATYHSEA